ncbi:MAG: hypothetical protein V3T86_01070 [Planctomycetota bacterium]
MRTLLGLLIVACPLLAQGVEAQPEAAHRLAALAPADAVAFLEMNGITPKVVSVIDSDLGRAVAAHPIVKAIGESPQLGPVRLGLLALKDATDHDLESLTRALGSREMAIGIYPSRTGKKQPDVVFLARVDGPATDRFLKGLPLIVLRRSSEVVPAEGGRPAIRTFREKTFYYRDGDLLVVASHRDLAKHVRDHVGRSVADTAYYQGARTLAGDGRLMFGAVDLATLRAVLPRPKKAKDLGAALFQGTLSERLYGAPFLGIGVDLVESRGQWTLSAEALVPRTESEGPLQASFGGKLEPLPFELPEHTAAVLRMRRDLEAVWSHKDAVIAEAGIPGLVQLETTFTALSGGMNFVEEFLPAFGKELTILATRPVYTALEAPAVQYPHVALIGRMTKVEGMETKLTIAFQTTIGIVNAQRAQQGEKPFLIAPEIYAGQVIQSARYLPPDAMEMSGMEGKGLPVRYNIAPSLAIVGGHLVIASSPELIKRLIDGQGKSGVLGGVNAGLWLDGTETRKLLEANRDALVAQNMISKGHSKAEAEQEVGGLIDLGRFIRRFELSVEEGRRAHGLRFEIVAAAPKE